MLNHTYSFVVDSDPVFAYQGWHLAHSLVEHCGARPSDIHVQCTPECDAQSRRLFEAEGFRTHTLQRFGDGKYCNKLAQLENLETRESDVVVLLDTDTIAVSDLRPWLHDGAVAGKIVDAANPPLETLREIAALAGVETGAPCPTDCGDGVTFTGNCNGGLYVVPGRYCALMSREWKRWATWLLANIEPLRRVNKEVHVDQVSFWLTTRSTGVPFQLAASNLNFFVHFSASRAYLDASRPIALIHYHNSRLNVLGKIDQLDASDVLANTAIARANEQIGRHFNNALFWDYRYRHWPERGSGVGSRGENLRYKQALLRAEGIEHAASVLDIGCGDLEVIKELQLRRYTGLDLSPVALERARRTLPSGDFRLGLDLDVPPADFVLCLEVLIHQKDAQDYHRVIQYAVARTQRSLIISGYQADSEAIRSNSMVFAHEPLQESLLRTGAFSRVRPIGAHSDVVIFRCDV